MYHCNGNRSSHGFRSLFMEHLNWRYHIDCKLSTIIDFNKVTSDKLRQKTKRIILVENALVDGYEQI